jgi:hypothetical protein
MTAISKTHTFVPGTPIESAQANQNFDDLVNYTNDEVIVRDASKAFTVTPAGPATDPTSANQFTRKQYVDNADALRAKLDGTTPFTGIPSGPATNPTTENQFTRKKYVDDSAVTPLTFRPSMATTGQIIKAADAVVTTDAFGHATVTFPTAFATALDTLVVTSGDAGVPTQFMSIHAKSNSNFTVRCFTSAVVADGFGGFTLQRAVSQGVRVSYIAIGR